MSSLSDCLSDCPVGATGKELSLQTLCSAVNRGQEGALRLQTLGSCQVMMMLQKLPWCQEHGCHGRKIPPASPSSLGI